MTVADQRMYLSTNDADSEGTRLVLFGQAHVDNLEVRVWGGGCGGDPLVTAVDVLYARGVMYSSQLFCLIMKRNTH